MSEYERLIQQGKDSRYLPGHWTRQWEELLDDPVHAIPEVASRIRSFQEQIRKSLQGGTLVDLGSGLPRKEIVDIVKLGGVKRYIRVDLHEGMYINPEGIDLPEVDVTPVVDDMLAYTASLPDNTVNFTINGIDDCVIKDYAYHKALAKEMLRATKPGGLILACNAEVSTYFFYNYAKQVEVLTWDNHQDRFIQQEHVFQKIVS